MAIKGGDLLHIGNQVLIERAQTAGPGQLNIPSEKVYELGNYHSVATIFDIPDLTFNLDSLDASAALEALLTHQTYSTMAQGTAIDLSRAVPLDVLGQFKPGRLDTNPFDVHASIVTPYLTLEQVNYRFGLKDKAQQTAVLRGDSIYYNPGPGFDEEFVGTATAGQVVTPAHPAFPYKGDVLTGTRYMLGVMTFAGRRLRFGTDYTEVAGAPDAITGASTVTVNITAAVAVTDGIRICYASPVTATYPGTTPPGTIHTPDSVTKPAAIRGKDIEVYVGGELVSNRWNSVQAVTCDYRVTLQKDEEFGNRQFVSQDYDVPTVNGTIQIKPRDITELLTRVRQVANVATPTEVAGPLNTTPLEVLIRLHSPIDGSVLKDIVVPDARITVPAVQGRVNQKIDVTFNFESDGGNILVYKGGK